MSSPNEFMEAADMVSDDCRMSWAPQPFCSQAVETTKSKLKRRAVADAPAVSVVVTPVVQKTVPLFTELTARTDATDTVEIRARVKAFLQTQSYTEGTMVKAGQVLFTLDKREYEAQLHAGPGPAGESGGGSGAGAGEVRRRHCAGQRADCTGAVEQDGSGCQAAQAAGRT